MSFPAILLAQPWLLPAGVLAVAPLVLAWRARRRGLHVSALSTVLQALAVALAAVALAQPQLPSGLRAQKPYILLDDVSDSTRAQRQPLPWPDRLQRRSYQFAAGVTQGQATVGNLRTDRTELASALEVAEASPWAGVVIRTDGQFQDAGWPQAATRLARRGLPVMIVPMISPPADARIAELAATRGGDGKTIALRLSVASNALQRRGVKLWRSAAQTVPTLLLERQLDLLPDQGATLHIDDAAAPGETVLYRAQLSAGDEFPENDQATQVSPPVTRRLAVIAKDPAGAAPLAAGGAADMPAPRSAPTDATGYLGYSAVVLNDARGDLLDARQRAALAEFVRGGGGLVLLGAGPHGAPADLKDPLNGVAALVPNPFERRPLKVLVVLDASGSMAEAVSSGEAAGQLKFSIVSQAVLSLQEHLTPHDALSIITFSDAARRIYDSGDGAPDFAAAASALTKVRPSGSTHVLPALEEALARPELAGRQGLVLLASDLRTETIDDPDALAARFKQAGLSLAIVAALAGPREPQPYPLELLAGRMGATLVRSEGFLDLAEVFARLVRRARPGATRTGQFTAQAVTGAALPNQPMPTIDQYLLCAPAEGASVLTTAVSSGNRQDAILARRTVGLGRSVTLALPLDGRANPAWRSWPALGEFVGGLVAWAAAPPDDPRMSAELLREQGALAIELYARDERGPVNLLDLTARMLPAGAAETPRETRLQQIAPGRYRAKAQVPPTAAAVAVCDASGRTLWQGAAAGTCEPEFWAIGPNWDNLRRLADLTGGKIVKASDLAALAEAQAAAQSVPLWPYALAAALAAMLLDWVTVRILRRD